MDKTKQLSSPKSTGGSGVRFESHVQSSFVVLMLAGGFAPCLPGYPITSIKLQGKKDGYQTDDLIIHTRHAKNNHKRKMLCQIKETIPIGKNKLFQEVITAAWADFNNLAKFTKNVDVIALITGPMSTADVKDVRTILEWSRTVNNASSFFENVNRSNYSSNGKIAKLSVFRECVTQSKGSSVTDEELFQFLRHFHFLGYDLDVKTGVTLSLLHSLIGIYSPDDAHSLWAEIVCEIQYLNSNPNEITKESIPEKIRSAFIQRTVQTIPEELVSTSKQDTSLHINSKYHQLLAHINLIGAWNEGNNNDESAISLFLNEGKNTWLDKVRDVLLEINSPLKLSNGRWRISDRKKLWIEFGARVFDEMATSFQKLAIEVLSEIDPQFELEPQRRITARILGKNLKYSHEIRSAVAESLVLFSTRKEALSNLSVGLAETVPILAVRTILKNGSWQLWASLGRLLVTLAETAPDEFLAAVEDALQQEPCPFDELFAQEGDGLFVANNMTSVLWALETLAWDEKYLVRVCIILAWLDTHDPEGRSGNRPINSLVTILLPWYPQTLASFDVRKRAFLTIKEELPDVAWKLVNQLLPNKFQHSSGTAKPTWRNIVDEDWKPTINKKEYIEHVSFYSESAVSLAKGNIERLNFLAKDIENFSEKSLMKMIREISIDSLKKIEESKLLNIWHSFKKLKETILKSDFEKSLKEKMIIKLTKIIDTITPKSPLNLYANIFSNEYLLRDRKNETWQEREKRGDVDKVEALKKIISFGGFDAVLEFAKSLDEAYSVGNALADIASPKTDEWLLPTYINTNNNKYVELTRAYIRRRISSQKWNWVDEVDMSNWNEDQKAQFLSHHPFNKKTWIHVGRILGKNESKYWSSVNVNGYHEKENISIAIDKLVEYKRPTAALHCLYQSQHGKDEIDILRSIKLLLASPNSKEPELYRLSKYEIGDIIKKLQVSELTKDQLSDMLTIEWIYLQLLDKHTEAKSKFLQLKMAVDPAFFVEIIQMLYQSNKESDIKVVITEEKRRNAEQAYRLLEVWRIIPGTDADGNFSEKAFTKWLSNVKKLCTDSGHWEMASYKIGKNLYHAQADKSGLWINKTIAKELNALGNDRMRDGFRTGRNSHGILRPSDSTGEYDDNIGKNYQKKAVELEKANFHRFAITLNNIADYYFKEAERTRYENEKA